MLTKEVVYKFFTNILTPPMSPQIVDRIIKEYENPEDAYIACYFVRNTLPENMPEEDKIKIAKTNIPNRNTVNTTIGEYVIKPSSGPLHVDAILQHEVVDKDGKIIATFNFYVLPRTKDSQGKIVINAIQGVKGKEQELIELSKTVGENWRIFLVKMIKRIATAKKLKLIGRLPRRFYLIGPECNDAEYKRQLRQYIQTFLKAGIPLENIDFSGIKEGPHKEWTERNLRTKEMRRPEKQEPKRKRPEIRRPRI